MRRSPSSPCTFGAGSLLLGILGSLGAVAFPALPLGAQGTLYTLDPTSVYVSGCTGPSPCACPVFAVGPLAGSFRLVPLLPQRIWCRYPQFEAPDQRSTPDMQSCFHPETILPCPQTVGYGRPRQL